MNRVRELRVSVQLVQDVHQHIVVELRLVDRAAACGRLRAWQLLRRLGQGAAVASVMHRPCEHHREQQRTSLQPRRRSSRMLRSQSNQNGCGVTPATLLMMAALENIIAELRKPMHLTDNNASDARKYLRPDSIKLLSLPNQPEQARIPDTFASYSM